jgi:hypothetical protein
MNTICKRFALASGTGFCMSAVVWFFVSERSPVYQYFLQQAEMSYGVLLLNLPALFLSRVCFGTPPPPLAVYLACFVQWFALGLALSRLAWRSRERVTR